MAGARRWKAVVARPSRGRRWDAPLFAATGPTEITLADSGQASEALQPAAAVALPDSAAAADGLQVAAAVTLPDSGAAADTLALVVPATITFDQAWHNETSSAAGTSPTVALTGVQDGEWVHLVVACRTGAAGLGAATITDNQSYWTVHSTFADSGADDNRVFFCSRVWHTGDPTSFDWTSTVACTWELAATGFLNTLQSGPVGNNTGQQEAAAGSTAHQTATINVPTSGARVVTSVFDRSASTWTPPTGYTEVADFRAAAASAPDAATAISDTTLTGTQGPLTWTGTVSTSVAGTWIAELKPALVPTGGETPVTLPDSGQAADQAQVAAAAPLADSAVGSGVLQVAATVPVLDSGAGADQIIPAAQIPLPDQGGAADTLQTAAVLAVNTFEGGTDEITITTANSGGGSGTAADATSTGAGATLAFDTAQAAHGSLSCRVATGGTATTSYFAWAAAVGTQATHYGRAYLYVTANPAATHRLFTAVGAAAVRATVQLTTGGLLRSANAAGTTLQTMTTPVALNQWIRVEWFIVGSATTGQVEVKLFNSPEATTPTETITSSAAENTGGTVDTYRFGIGAGVASIGPYWQDDLGVGTGGYLGPATGGQTKTLTDSAAAADTVTVDTGPAKTFTDTGTASDRMTARSGPFYDGFNGYTSGATITNAGFYTTAAFPFEGASGPTNPSGLWEMDTGQLLANNAWGYSGTVAAGNGGSKFFFRLKPRGLALAEQDVTWRHKTKAFEATQTGDADAVAVWMRYRTQYDLYEIVYDKRDNTLQAKRKVPCDLTSGTLFSSGDLSNKGVYYNVLTDAEDPHGAGLTFQTYTSLGLSNFAHDATDTGGTVYRMRATVTTTGTNKLRLQLFRDGVLVGSWTDNQSNCQRANGQTLAQDFANGLYAGVTGWQDEWASPITRPGTTGLRSDNIETYLDDFQVQPFPALTDSGQGTDSLTPRSAYDTEVLADGPVAYWTMSAPGSGSEPDQTGNGHTGTYVGTPASRALPNGDQAAVFNGVSQYLTAADHDAFSVPTTGRLTVEAWLSPDVRTFPDEEGTGYVHWLGKGDTNQHEWAARIYGQDSTDIPFRENRISGYAFNPTGGQGTGSFFQDPVHAPGEWIHYVLVINTADAGGSFPNGYTKIYKNGVLRDQDDLFDTAPVVPVNGTAPVTVGTRATLASFFQGPIGKVAVYPTELSATRIMAHRLAMTGGAGVYEEGAAADQLQAAAAAPLADSGAGSDTLAVNQGPAAVALPDSGQASDQALTAAQVPLVDLGNGVNSDLYSDAYAAYGGAGGVDTLATTATVPLPESAAAADTLTVAQGNVNTLPDSGSGADTLRVVAAVALPDSGTANEQVPVAAQVPLPDSGAAADQAQVAQFEPKALTDTAAAADTLRVVVAATLADSGQAGDQLTPAAVVVLADSGTGAETLQINQGIPKSLADAGVASDQTGITVQVPLPDQGQATDTLAADQTRTLLDNAAGVDTLSVGQFVPKPVNDAAAAADQLLPAAQSPLADSGAAADTVQVAAQAALPDSGSGAGADTLAVAQARLLADSGAANDQLVVIQGRVLTDSGSSADTLRPAALLAVADTATAGDLLALAALSALGDHGAASDTLVVLTVARWIRTTSRERPTTTASREPALATSSREKGTL